MDVNIYIAEERIDLYKEENINLIMKLSDIEKLSNLFTNFTLPFTVPATDNNNNIFNHYYDFDIENSFNANVRVVANIEYKTIPFVNGNIQLEGVKMKNGKPSSYKLTFYDDLKQLTDLFGEDTLDRLDYIGDDIEPTYTNLSQYNYELTSANWLSLFYDGNVVGNDNDIFIPLISVANRDWNMGVDSGEIIDYDITSNDGAMRYSELRSAFRVYNLIVAIEEKYDIEFTGTFFDKAMFRNLFLFMNKYQDASFDDIDFPHENAFTGTDTPGYFTDDNPYVSCYRRLYSDFVPGDGEPYETQYSLEYTWDVTPTNLDLEYGLKLVNLVNDTEVIIKEYTEVMGAKTISHILYSTVEEEGTDIREEKVKLVIVPQQSMSFTDVDINCQYYSYDEDPAGAGEIVLVDKTSLNNTYSATQYGYVESNIPDLSVIAFIQGLMKMFKLVILPESSTVYNIDTLDTFYKDGEVKNFNNYIDLEQIQIDRPKLYTELNFNFKKTNNLLGKKHREDFDPFQDKRGYGDIRASYEVDSKEKLDVSVPFENMLFERVSYFDGTYSHRTEVVIGQSVKTDDWEEFKENKSGPILFFDNGITSLYQTSLKAQFGGETHSIDYVRSIGNTDDKSLNQVTQTLNWGAEIDPYHETQMEQSLFYNYWRNWLTTIYSERQRKVNLKAQLPAIEIENLKLSDRIVIGTNRFKINDYNINLNTGEVKFNLFNDIFENEPIINSISSDYIYANAGRKYYGVQIVTEYDWEIVKVENGDGVDWVHLLSMNGSGSGEITFYVDSIVDETDPYTGRNMGLEVRINGSSFDEITVEQLPLREAASSK